MQLHSRLIIHAAFAACLASCAAEPPTKASAVGSDPLIWIDGAEGLAKGQRFRLANVEAPSVGAQAACDRERELGEKAKEFITGVTSGDNADLKLTTVGRLPRSKQRLATVTAQGEDIAEIGLRSGHLAHWEHGYTKPIEPPPVWCLDGDNHRKHEVISRARWANTIGEREVSFVAFDMESGIGFELEGSLPHERRAPWSTFKIPNLLLALETRVAMGLDHKIDWDRERRPAAGYWPKDWQQDQTLRNAFKRSAAWAFQDVALAIGSEVYREKLKEWAYGNLAVEKGSDSFWLDKTLAISPNEQVSFLARLLSDRIDVEESSIEALKIASQEGNMAGGTLHGKTGAGPVTLNDFEGRFEGWYVGFVERSNRAPLVFALHVEGQGYASIHKFRKEFAVTLLRHVVALNDERNTLPTLHVESELVPVRGLAEIAGTWDIQRFEDFEPPARLDHGRPVYSVRFFDRGMGASAGCGGAGHSGSIAGNRFIPDASNTFISLDRNCPDELAARNRELAGFIASGPTIFQQRPGRLVLHNERGLELVLERPELRRLAHVPTASEIEGIWYLSAYVERHDDGGYSSRSLYEASGHLILNDGSARLSNCRGFSVPYRFANGRFEPVGTPSLPACDLFEKRAPEAKGALALFANALNAEWDVTGALVLWSGNHALVLSRSPTKTSTPPKPK